MAWGALLALLWAATAGAAAARLKSDATLHAKPSETSDAVGKLSAGTRVDVLSESGGWHEVKAPAGRGFVRGEQLVLGELAEPAAKPAEKKPDKAPPRADEPREAERVAAEQLRQLTDEVRLLRERPDPVTAADLQRVEEKLTQAIAGSCENRPAAAAAPPPPADPPLPDTSLESVLAVSPVLLLVGGVVGWIAGRMSQRRRDHRNRIRV
jgi:uncharacterized protein YgiM (DUF1202 family)